MNEVSASAVHCADGYEAPYDEVVWCTPGAAAPWLRTSTDLALDDEGFIAV